MVVFQLGWRGFLSLPHGGPPGSTGEPSRGTPLRDPAARVRLFLSPSLPRSLRSTEARIPAAGKAAPPLYGRVPLGAGSSPRGGAPLRLVFGREVRRSRVGRDRLAVRPATPRRKSSNPRDVFGVVASAAPDEPGARWSQDRRVGRGSFGIGDGARFRSVYHVPLRLLQPVIDAAGSLPPSACCRQAPLRPAGPPGRAAVRFLVFTTLRRTRPGPRGARAAMCVRNADDHCVLQFTLILAVGCVLHRRTSRVIHRRELSLGLPPRGGRVWPPSRTASLLLFRSPVMSAPVAGGRGGKRLKPRREPDRAGRPSTLASRRGPAGPRGPRWRSIRGQAPASRSPGARRTGPFRPGVGARAAAPELPPRKGRRAAAAGLRPGGPALPNPGVGHSHPTH